MIRAKRTPSKSRALDPKFRAFLAQIRSNSREIGECEGRVLRLKPTVSSNARPEEINMVLDALTCNWRVEVLYIQNFELVRSACVATLTLNLRVCSAALMWRCNTQCS
jgi:hypothetical protein